jgi:hypothetical protein
MQFASTMRHNAHLRATVHVLLNEDSVRGVAVRLLHRIRPLRDRAHIDGFHHWSRTEWFGCRGHSCGNEHVSHLQQPIFANCKWLTALDSMVAHTTSLKYRPIFSAIAGGVECMALALGPFLSGAIAHYASWRISFYIIIPSSALGIVIVFFSIGHLRKADNAHLTNKDVLKKIDWVGFGISMPMTLTLVLALQWGGTVHAWSNWRIILLLVLAGVLTASFIFWERKVGDSSMIPLKMLKQRSVALASIITFCDFAHLSVVAYYVSMLRCSKRVLI